MRTPVSEALGWTLFHFLWEGVIVAAMLAMLLAVVRSARIRYTAGCAAMLAMLACFAITLIHFWPADGGVARAAMETRLPPFGSLPVSLRARVSFRISAYWYLGSGLSG